MSETMGRTGKQQRRMGLLEVGFAVVCLCSAQTGFAAAASGGHLDEEIGAEAAVTVAAQMGFYDDPAISEYVTGVGERLVGVLQDTRFTFRFFVVDDASPNAFALPGGFVFVTRGLLPLLQTEDELAGVMAHEIIHVTERHGVQRSRRGLFGALFYSLEDSSGTPATLGDTFVAGLPEEYQRMIDRAEPVTVNGMPGYVVTLVQNPKSGEKIYVHIAWVAFDTFTLRLAAYGTDALQETLRTSARSFRRLTGMDRAAIERIQIRIATAKGGESLADFSARVDNRLNEDLTRAINDIEGDTLESGRLKILEIRPYFDNGD
jgi:predicted Zn-dependent protease